MRHVVLSGIGKDQQKDFKMMVQKQESKGQSQNCEVFFYRVVIGGFYLYSFRFLYAVEFIRNDFNFHDFQRMTTLVRSHQVKTTKT